MELNQSVNSGRFAWTLLASVVQTRLPNTTPTSCTLDSNFGHCTLEKYSKIYGVGEYNILVRQSVATQTGLHCPPRYLEKRTCVSTSHMQRDAS